MKHPALVLAIGLVACAPSKDIESPADPPGIENEDDKAQSSDGQASASGEVSVGGEAEAEAEGD